MRLWGIWGRGVVSRPRQLLLAAVSTRRGEACFDRSTRRRRRRRCSTSHQNRNGGDESITDLLEQNRGLQDGVSIWCLLWVCGAVRAFLSTPPPPPPRSLTPKNPTKHAHNNQVFACLYTLTKNRQAVSMRMTALRVVLEFLQAREGGGVCCSHARFIIISNSFPTQTKNTTNTTRSSTSSSTPATNG